MDHKRRRFLILVAGAAALPAVSRIATAQTYPTRPVLKRYGCAGTGRPRCEPSAPARPSGGDGGEHHRGEPCTGRADEARAAAA